MENNLINELIDYLKTKGDILTEFKYLKKGNIVDNIVDNISEADRIEIRGRCKNSNRYLTIIITLNNIVFYKSFSWDTIASKREILFEVKDDLTLENIRNNLDSLDYFD